ncbi:hypothetical protein [Pedobacter nototheniae]|uniref:hypothetical protein n=1 Tax=Pedobacter nototheniae TaxID=2488994 RepID=UPI00103E6C0D|nr:MULTISPECIES: hypothetical protein [Pedobacter]
MNLKGILLIVVCLIVFSNNLQAAAGCLIPSTKTVYTQTDDVGLVNALLIAIFGGVQAYKPNPNEPQTSNCVANNQTVWVAGSSPCRVCPSGYNVLNLVTGCSGTALDGFVANSTVVQCNLDDYTLPLSLGAGLFGFMLIRKRNKV